MREYIKSYRVFVSEKWVKVLLYLVYPLATVGICRFLLMFSDLYGMIHQVVAASVMIFAELVLDVFAYGGILQKGTGKLDYLKLSNRGMEIVHKSLWADKVRRLLTTVFILSGAYLVCHEGMSVGQLVSGIFATAMVLELSLLISRRFDAASTVMALSYVIYLVGPVFILLAILTTGHFMFLYMVAYVGVLIWSNTHIMKRARRVYYDSESEKES